jgi:hypothetical protein
MIMMSKVCRATRREIDESEVHQALSETAAMHLQTCSGCRDFRAQRTRLRDLIGSLEPVVAPADFDFRLRARLASHRQSKRQDLFSGFRLTVPAKVAAAVLVLLLGSIVWINQRMGTQGPSVAKVEQQNPTAGNATTGPDEAAIKTSPKVDTNKAADGALAQNEGSTLAPKPVRVSSRPRSEPSYDASETAAESVKGSDDAGDVSLSAPVKPLVVSMEDDRGATRTISLPPVSFGAQRLVDNRVPSNQVSRVW